MLLGPLAESKVWLCSNMTQSQDYLEDSPHHGTYSQFSGCAHQDDAGYLCPLPNQNWNSTWQSYHRHHTGLSSHGAFTPDTAMTNLMTDEEAPPAYSPGQTMSEWYPRSTATLPSRDYAEIMTVPLRPPPISPPVLPPSALNGHNALNGHASPLLSNTLPISRDFIPGNMSGICYPPANMPGPRDIPVTREMPVAVSHDLPVSSGLPVHSTAPAASSSQDGQNLNRLLPGLISDYSTKLQVSSALWTAF